mmetsp:Transcript_41345/g.127786  ORF Transcript_41345/g.127786 Transcript_41345/m.127786 type:complete len:249 (-) Transcript_41345:203-949(-)
MQREDAADFDKLHHGVLGRRAEQVPRAAAALRAVLHRDAEPAAVRPAHVRHRPLPIDHRAVRAGRDPQSHPLPGHHPAALRRVGFVKRERRNQPLGRTGGRHLDQLHGVHGGAARPRVPRRPDAEHGPAAAWIDDAAALAAPERTVNPAVAAAARDAAAVRRRRLLTVRDFHLGVRVRLDVAARRVDDDVHVAPTHHDLVRALLHPFRFQLRERLLVRVEFHTVIEPFAGVQRDFVRVPRAAHARVPA